MSVVPEYFDAAAATAMYQRCFGELVGYLDRLLGDRAAAEDTAQEAGLRLIDTARNEPLSLRAPRAFLYQVATNLARDQLRRRVRSDRVMGELQHDVMHAPGADVIAGAREEIELINAALADLPPRPREILLLSRVEGLSHAQIGERLGITAKTVENHVGRALGELARVLGRRRS